MGLMASTGVKLPIQVIRNLRIARELVGDVRLLVGFAVNSPQSAAELINAGADGVVVGSAFIRRIMNGDPLALVREIHAVAHAKSPVFP
jgi:tryptophan synthase alpha chain